MFRKLGELGEVEIKQGIVQGDSLPLLVLVSAMIPLRWLACLK